MKTIKQTYTIKSTVADVWRALVNPTEIEGWGGGPAKMNARVGARFSLWGGSIWGKNIEVIAEKKLVQEWYSDEQPGWEKPSMVTFTLQKNTKGVVVTLLHADVPDIDAKNIRSGWREYYLGAIKKYLESNL